VPHRAIEIPLMRSLRWLGFYAVILLAWFAIYQMARSGGDWLCGPDSLGVLPLGGFWALFPMWLVMIAAMMLPTLVPALQSYEDLPAKAGATSQGWLGLVLGYVAVWAIASAAFAATQVWAMRSEILDLTGSVTSVWLAVSLFALAGLYQFSKLKEACQNGCLTPLQYYMTHWSPGLVGGFRMGSGLGLICVGCCWAIMALGFVGGMTSLWWMGIATVFMVAEKLPDIGQHLRLPAGIILLAIGAAIAVRAMAFA
jgi:predicted metal-binding membrane protein